MPHADRVLRWLPRYAALMGAALIAAACGSSPSPPSSPTPPVTQPPVTQPPTPQNAAPVIRSVTSSSPRVEADEDVQLTAVVEDAETSADQLVYAWAAKPVAGEFIGTGRQVRWRAPHLQTTPDLYTITLTVTENFTLSGQSQQHQVSSNVDVRYNDSYRDINRLATDFLVDKFGNYNVSPEEAVSNFSDNCAGKAAELSDVRNNRQLFQILSASFSVSSITLNGDKTQGNVSGACTFRDIIKQTGRTETVNGICRLTAVYENWRWLLCTSTFEGTGTTINSLRYAHP